MPVSRNRGGKKRKSNKVMSNQNKPVKQQQPSHTITATRTQAEFKGEIFHSNYPPPEYMEHYAQIDPTFPQQMLEMAKTEGIHRRWMEKFVYIGSLVLDFLGMLAALAAVAGILYVGWLFMKAGNAREGAWIIGAVTAAIAIAFLTRGRSAEKKKK